MNKVISISTMYTYLWKAKWEILLEYIVIDSVQDSLIERGMSFFLSLGSSKAIVHDCSSHELLKSIGFSATVTNLASLSASDNRLPSSNTVVRSLSSRGCADKGCVTIHKPDDFFKEIEYCGAVGAPDYSHVPQIDDKNEVTQQIQTTASTAWSYDYLMSLGVHLAVKATATATFPLIYSGLIYSHQYTCEEKDVCKKIEHVTEYFVKFIGINPLEGLYIFDAISNDNIVKYFPNYIASRADDSNFEEFMTAYARWMELVDAGMHAFDHVKNIIQNWHEPYMLQKVLTLLTSAVVLKYNTDVQEQKIDEEIETYRNHYQLPNTIWEGSAFEVVYQEVMSCNSDFVQALGEAIAVDLS